jgi:hypothetical protein
MDEEGWYVDPYGVHEARWISAGTPTALVRDGEIEAQDPPPDTEVVGNLVQLAEVGPDDGADLLRADSAESTSFDPVAEEEAAWDSFGSTGGGD